GSRKRISNIASRNDNQALIDTVSAGEIIKLCRPRRRSPTPVVPGAGYGEADCARAAWRGYLRAANRGRSNVSVQIGVVLTTIRQDFHRFKAMRKVNRPAA